jgi:hypothetical protein
LSDTELTREPSVNEKQLAKLIKKTTAKAEQRINKPRPNRNYDPTLQNRDEDDKVVDERQKAFDEMKRREF